MYRLREISRQDIQIINKWRNEPELISNLGAPFRYINFDVDQQWYEDYLKSRYSTIRCAIVNQKNEEEILGLVSLTNINHLNQNAVFHIMLGQSKNRGKGIGYFATTEMLKHAFYNMNLQRIELTVLESNVPAINLYKKVGFKVEGMMRNAIYKNGVFLNVFLMSILREEFETE